MPNRKKLRARRDKSRELSKLDIFAWDYNRQEKYVAPDLLQSIINDLRIRLNDTGDQMIFEPVIVSVPISLGEMSERYETTEETK